MGIGFAGCFATHKAVKDPALNGCSEGHVKAQARILTVKRFLADMWVIWREQENLPVTEPYIIAQGNGHTLEPNLIKEPDSI